MIDALALTVFSGERERAADDLLSDALLDAFERHGVPLAALLRGSEGFGAHHALRTDRLLTLSEDLPLVSLAAGPVALVRGLLPDVERLVGKGLVTLERARLLAGEDGWTLPPGLGDELKLTLLAGRKERAGGRPAYVAAVDLLRERGVAGATAFLGVDGMHGGARRRARFFSRNAGVPVVVVAVGARASFEQALPALGALLERTAATLAPARILRGPAGGSPLPEAPEPTRLRQRLTVLAAEDARHAGHSLSGQLVRRLRAAGAAGVTSVRGVWGYAGADGPHGDRLLALRRRVPVATVVVDTPEAMRSWWPIVDELTAEAGVVTCETVSAFGAGERLQSDAG